METNFNLLTDLDLDEVSLVTDGANQHAKVMLAKKNEENRMSKNPIVAGIEKLFSPFAKDLDDSSKQEFEKGLKEFEETIAKAEYGDEEEMDKEMSDFMDSLSESDKAMFMEKSMDERRKMMEGHMAKANDDVNKGVEALSKADVDTMISKALEPVRKENEDLRKSNAALEEALAKRDAQDALRSMTDDLKKANVPAAPAVAEKLMKVADLDLREELKKDYIANGERVTKAGFFSESGSAGDSSGDTAYAKFNKMAQDLAQQEGIHKSVAFRKVFRDPANRELKAEYMRERRSAN